MKITRSNDFLIVRIPLWQDSFDALGENCGKVSNIIGVIHGDNIGFAQEIDMTYKGKGSQIGDFFVMWWGDKDGFYKLCNKLKINVFEYPICKTCHKPIHGSCTYNDKGECCFDCDYETPKGDNQVPS